jgi:hypothetical protein
MIRVNLLRGHGITGRMDVPLAPMPRHSFVSGTELMLGGVFLLLGCAILFTQFKKFEVPSLSSEQASLSSAGAVLNSVPEVRPEEVAIQEEPVQLQATLEAPTTTHESEPAKPPEQSQAALAGEEAPASGETANAPDPEPVAPSPVVGGEMHQFFVSTMQGAVRVFAGTGTGPVYQTFRLENPNRVVVDLPGVIVALPFDRLDQVVDHPQVHRVRAAQHSIDPPVARLVIDVSSFPKVEFFPQFNGLYIRVSENTE